MQVRSNQCNAPKIRAHFFGSCVFLCSFSVVIVRFSLFFLRKIVRIDCSLPWNSAYIAWPLAFGSAISICQQLRAQLRIQFFGTLHSQLSFRYPLFRPPVRSSVCPSGRHLISSLLKKVRGKFLHPANGVVFFSAVPVSHTLGCHFGRNHIAGRLWNPCKF